MKARILITLLLALSLLLCSCQSSVSTAITEETKTATPAAESGNDNANAPSVRTVFQMPDYTLPANATVDEMRAMAVKAMHDELSFHWTPSENFTYQKEAGAAANKDFTYVSGKVYAGLPYTNGGSGILQWLQNYDFETGVVTGLNGKALDSTLGNSCATSVMWGWSAVSTNVFWNATYSMNTANGCVNVGPYTYDPAMTDMSGYTTNRICSDNGEKTMYESYAAILPADGLVTAGTVDHHAIMAIEAAHVERGADGAIDPEKSFITLQDQRASFVEAEHEGENVCFRGSLSSTKTFKKLFTDGYIPITTKEFAGLVPYTPASVSYSGSTENLEAFSAGSVQCPYKIVTVNFIITDEAGNAVANKKTVLGRTEIANGEIYNYPISDLSLKTFFTRNVKNAGNYHGKLEVLVATGASFTPVEFDFVYEG